MSNHYCISNPCPLCSPQLVSSNYVQVIEQTDEEKMGMYMKCSKEDLAKMVIQCNKLLDKPPVVSHNG